jgi:hypothetical protein
MDRQVLVAILKAKEHTVLEATRVTAALEQVLQHRPVL